MNNLLCISPKSWETGVRVFRDCLPRVACLLKFSMSGTSPPLLWCNHLPRALCLRNSSEVPISHPSPPFLRCDCLPRAACLASVSLSVLYVSFVSFSPSISSSSSASFSFSVSFPPIYRIHAWLTHQRLWSFHLCAFWSGMSPLLLSPPPLRIHAQHKHQHLQPTQLMTRTLSLIIGLNFKPWLILVTLIHKKKLQGENFILFVILIYQSNWSSCLPICCPVNKDNLLSSTYVSCSFLYGSSSNFLKTRVI